MTTEGTEEDILWLGRVKVGVSTQWAQLGTPMYNSWFNLEDEEKLDVSL